MTTAYSLKFPAIPVHVSSALALEHQLSKRFNSTVYCADGYDDPFPVWCEFYTRKAECIDMLK